MNILYEYYVGFIGKAPRGRLLAIRAALVFNIAV